MSTAFYRNYQLFRLLSLTVQVIGILLSSCLSWLAFHYGKLPAMAVEDNSKSQKLAQMIPSVVDRRPTLQTGSEGNFVSELQAALKLLGYYTGSVNGFYGEESAIAVSNFQRAAGLNPDGIVGEETWKRLFPNLPLSEIPSPPFYPNRGTAVEFPPPTSASTSASDFPVPSSLSTTVSTLNQRTNNTATLPARVRQPPANVTLPILREGMRGPAVRQLQQRLIALGFLKGTVDGVFGEATQAAVKAAQRNFQLEPDGVVGPSTWSALLR
ncbi:MAG: peptidoglycan-binding protein [Symploca sp. SIO2E9]|nr:peptidoglycan-binding protein [Symploca sp. SIO2E9]